MLRFRSYIPGFAAHQDDFRCAAILRGAAFLARRVGTGAEGNLHPAEDMSYFALDSPTAIG
jgi:hypothetical protein